MSDNSNAKVECPTCHLEVSVQARCELCGSALPEVTADEGLAEGQQRQDADQVADNNERGQADQVETAPQDDGKAKTEETNQNESPEQSSSEKAEPVDEPAADASSKDQDSFTKTGRQTKEETVEESVHKDNFHASNEGANQTHDKDGGTSYKPFEPMSAVAGDHKELLKRLFTDFEFEGRMARKPYWTMFAWRFGIGVLCGLIMADEPDLLGPIAALAVLVVSFSGLAEACRRLHDTGRSGWFNLLVLVPYVGFIGLIVLLALEPTEGDNQFGPKPAEGTQRQ